MPGRQHTYRTTPEWIGNKCSGTSDYHAYGRTTQYGDDPTSLLRAAK